MPPDETPGPLNVRGRITTVGPDAAIVSKGTITSEGTITSKGALTVGEGAGAVTLTPQAGTINSLLLNGQILSAHDALYAFAHDMTGTGTLLDEDDQDAGLPRWTFPDAATHRTKWVWQIPAEWDSVAVRFGWDKETAASGNVIWSYVYRLVYPFAAPDVDAGAVTTVALGAIAVPSTQFAFQYQLPSEISAIATADGAFGSKPFLQSALVRTGGDALDTFNGGTAAVSLATLTRVS